MKVSTEQANSKKTTRRLVVKAASRLFREQGIKAVRMDDIAKDLSMSKRTLYELFSDKEELLLECIVAHLKAKDRQLQKKISSSENVLEVLLYSMKQVLEELRGVSIVFYRDMSLYAGVAELVQKRREERYKRFVEAFKMGVSQGIFREEINFSILQLLIDTQLHMLFETNKWQQFSLSEMYKTIILVSVRGVCTLEGQRMMDDYLQNKWKNL